MSKNRNKLRLHKKTIIAFCVLTLLTLNSIYPSQSQTKRINSNQDFDSFQKWCENRENISAEAKRTVEAIVNSSDIYDSIPDISKSNCKEIGDALSKQKKLIILDYRDLEDLRPLSTLINLEELSLYGEYNSRGGRKKSYKMDPFPISKLINLKSLSMTSLNIENISSLKKLTKLESLSLPRNNISDISPLLPLKRLKDLSLQNNLIQDFRPLSRLVNLEELRIWGNPAKHVESLKNLPKLRYLNGPIK